MIIFDLDGTLADCEHRRHFVDPNKDPECKLWVNPNYDIFSDMHKINWTKKGLPWKPDWKSFYEACDKDDLIYPTLEILSTFKYSIEIQVWSGRCESVKNKTIRWFLDKWFLGSFENSTQEWLDEILKMRPEGDYTPDDILKERWLDEAIAEGKTIDFVFDDRKKVVEMWRRRGIFVFDVSQGKGDF